MNQERTAPSEYPVFMDGTSMKDGKTESIFQLVIVACLRHRQLNQGANPRVRVASPKTKGTRIAVEEVNQGLIVYNSIEAIEAD